MKKLTFLPKCGLLWYILFHSNRLLHHWCFLLVLASEPQTGGAAGPLRESVALGLFSEIK